MSGLNQEHEKAIKQLDNWVKYYIQKISAGFEASAINLYVEHELDQNSQKLKWGFSVEESIKKESLTIILDI